MSRISNQKVMSTPAGFYVGTTYRDDELGGDFPYSRDTDYMSEDQAIAMLKCWQEDEEE